MTPGGNGVRRLWSRNPFIAPPPHQGRLPETEEHLHGFLRTPGEANVGEGWEATGGGVGKGGPPESPTGLWDAQLGPRFLPSAKLPAPAWGRDEGTEGNLCLSLPASEP